MSRAVHPIEREPYRMPRARREAVRRPGDTVASALHPLPHRPFPLIEENA
ncbi:hypothetical protein ACFXG1_20695 [Streptomyces sp. NPDC059248]